MDGIYDEVMGMERNKNPRVPDHGAKWGTAESPSNRPILELGEKFASFFQQDGEAPTRPATVTIGRPLQEVWTFVRDLQNMPRFVRGLERVDVITSKVSHWVFNRDGKRYEYDSEIIAEEQGYLFAWRSLEDTKVRKLGVVMLISTAAGRSTAVSMKMSDDSTPGKILGLAKYFSGHEPKSESYINLRRMKAYIETGEVPTVEGQPNGRDENENLKKN